ncbi:sulfurtransferase [Actinomyces oricola]
MMPPVVDSTWLRGHPDAVVADVRWYLDGRSGAAAHASGHIPGAVWVDVNADLAAPPSREQGRHPFPAPEDFAATMSRLGIGDGAVVIAYDDAGGLSAGRLVWMLRLMGVDAALLDGGLGAWDGELSTEPVVPFPAHLTARPWPADALATMGEAAAQAADPAAPPVLDARAAARYRGQVEPTEAPAGHIPGALSAPMSDNLDDAGRFLPPAVLAEHYAALGITDAAGVTVYCGSGVSACHDLLAMERAGLGRGRLYVGSWSQYAFSGLPIAASVS